MAIVLCLEHWRIYAESCSALTIYTDHKNLVNFTTTKTLNRRQVRWSEMLGQYKFKVVYTPGKDNGRADALSRRPDIAGTKEVINTAILKVNSDGSLGPAHEINALLTVRTYQKNCRTQLFDNTTMTLYTVTLVSPERWNSLDATTSF
jgi:hypothetical protein